MPGPDAWPTPSDLVCTVLHPEQQTGTPSCGWRTAARLQDGDAVLCTAVIYTFLNGVFSFGGLVGNEKVGVKGARDANTQGIVLPPSEAKRRLFKTHFCPSASLYFSPQCLCFLFCVLNILQRDFLKHGNCIGQTKPCRRDTEGSLPL